MARRHVSVSSVIGTDTFVDAGDDAGFLPKSARVTGAADLPRGAGAGSAFVLTLTLPPWRKDAARESGVARARAGAMSPTEDDDARVLLAADGLAVTAARACLSIVVRVSAILQSS